MSGGPEKPARPARTDEPVTGEDLEGVAAVPQDGDGDGDRKRNRSGADAGERQGDEVDPGTG